jgi:hypothetical protein
MSQPLELARPEVARATCLHADQTRLQFAEERHHLAPAQRSTDDHVGGIINTVNLEYVLGQIEPDGGNIHDGWFPLLVVLDGNHTFGTLRCREREPSTPSALSGSSASQLNSLFRCSNSLFTRKKFPCSIE